MKTLVVYYSLENNVDLVANIINDNFDVELLRLKPKRNLNKNSFTKYLFGGFQSAFKLKPKLEDYSIDINMYDTIIFGTPVWASTFSPAIRSFINSQKIENKKVGIYACHRGGPGKAISELKASLPNNSYNGELEIREPNEQNQKELKDNIISWVNELTKK